MALDGAARNYAQNLFLKKMEEISASQREALVSVRSDFARRGILSSGPYVTAHANVLLEQTRLIAVARMNSLLDAYAKAGLPVDDAAVSEIRQEIDSLCEAQKRNLAAAVQQLVSQTFGGNAPNNLGSALSNQMESGVSRIKATLLRDLSILRDEAVLAARSQNVGKSAQEESRHTPLQRQQSPQNSFPKGSPVNSAKWGWGNVRSWTRDQMIAAALLVVAVVTLIGLFVVPEVRQHFGLEKQPQLTKVPDAPPKHTQPEPTQNKLVAEVGKSVSDLRQRHGVNSLPKAESGKNLEEIPANSYSFVSASRVVSRDRPLANVRATGLAADFEVHKLGDGTAIILGFVGPESLLRLREGLSPNADLTLYSDPWTSASEIVAVPLEGIKCDRDRDIFLDRGQMVTALDCKVSRVPRKLDP
jgi:hypothetical protein